MKSLKSWLIEYGEGHRHPVNRVLHGVCMPSILFALLCLLKAMPLGDALVNAATLLVCAGLLYYLWLSWQLALGMVIVSSLMYAGVLLLETALGAGLPAMGAALLGLALFGEFLGHCYEGGSRSCLRDPHFLLIGPVWLLAGFYRRLQIPMGAGAGALPLAP